VDNSVGGDAETKWIVQQFDSRLRIRYASEEESGLSHARNRGFSMAESDVLVFIDDDAIAVPKWLEEILAVYGVYSDAAAVGGRVSLIWETEIPAWLHSGLYGALSELDYGEDIREINSSERLNGCNFSIKRSWIQEVGVFSSQLGRRGRNLLSGEEVEMALRIRSRGGKCYYTPHALVHHLAPASRMNKSFFRRRVYWGSRSEARMDLMYAPQIVYKTMWHRIIRFPYHWCQSVRLKIKRQPALSFLWETFFWSGLGYLLEIAVNKISRSKISP
jgi:GT2 family glycosyltransferase